MKINAIRIDRPGPPSVMKWKAIELPEPAAGEVTVRHTAVGFNFIDCNHRAGRYPLPMPAGIGSEAAGVVETLGKGVKGLKTGQHVVYIGKVGTYAEAQNVPAELCVPVPRGISDEVAASVHLKGMTVEMLLERIHKAKRDEVLLLHSAAGGVGLMFCQWAKAKGATVIGTASSAAKCAEIRRAGAKHAIDTSKQDVVEQVRRITRGRGVDVVYDPIGKDTWETSLSCLKDRGLMVSFGGASGPIAPVDLNEPRFMQRAWFITRGSLFNYAQSREDKLASMRRVFSMIRTGKVKVEIARRYALKDAAALHRDVEARKTTGVSILVP